MPWPGHYAGHAANASEFQHNKIKEQLFDEMHGGQPHSRFDPDMDAGDEGFEADVIGTPCPAIMMAAAPQPMLIIIVPIGLIAFVSASCFLWEDYLTRVVAWKNGDMSWYMADHRMGPGSKAWSWWFQVFMELLYGLTEAWGALFSALGFFLKSSFSGEKKWGDEVTSFMVHGSNPINLFRDNFPKFRMAVLFWRFVLAAIFTIVRTTALINLPKTAIKPDERSEELDAYDEVEAMDVDPHDPYRGY